VSSPSPSASPRKHWLPSCAPDLTEVRELYEVRRTLELEAVNRPTLSGEPHDRDELLALRDDWQVLEPPADDGSDPEFVLLDEEFHIRLAHAAGNHALAELITQVNERIRPVRTHDFLTSERITLTIQQHLGVVGALLADDVKLASRLLLSHIGESMDVVEQRVAVAFARMTTREPRRNATAAGRVPGLARRPRR
jgi:DNA-binding GntR family transcriptional regulator